MKKDGNRKPPLSRWAICIKTLVVVLAILLSSCSNSESKSQGDISNDGTKWVKQEDLKVAANSICSLNESNIWVTASSGRVFFYDGMKWEEQYVANHSINEIVSADGSHAWAIGKELVFFFNGSEWSEQFSISEGEEHEDFERNPRFTSISACDASHAWAASNRGLFFYDGNSWSLDEGIQGEFISVAALDPYHVWTSTEDETYFFDGASWSKQADIGMFRLSAEDTSNVWGFANKGDGIYRLEASEWMRVASLSINLPSISAAGQGKLWLAGFKGIPGTAQGMSGFIYELQGKDMTVQHEEEEEGFVGISAIDEGEAWAVSEHGYVYRYKE